MKIKSAFKSVIALTFLCIPVFCQAIKTIDAEKILLAVDQEEKTLKARIGLSIINTADGKLISYRGDERFPLNSTHKALTCAALLKLVDEQKLKLTETVSFDQSRLVSYSPITEKHVTPDSMSWQDVCSASVSYSDNTAANLVFEKLGGPEKATQFLRKAGDQVSRMDRTEPEINDVAAGELRDTTTPEAIVKTLQKLLIGDVLSPESREQLKQWMVNDQVANDLLRSQLPQGWTIADKTGSGNDGSRSIISVIWPEYGDPLIVTIYITQTSSTVAESNKAIARIGKVMFENMYNDY